MSRRPVTKLRLSSQLLALVLALCTVWVGVASGPRTGRAAGARVSHYATRAVASARSTARALGLPLAPAVNLSVSGTEVVEQTVYHLDGSQSSTTSITVTATAEAAVSGNQTVQLSVTGTGITPGDYTLSNATITIPNGQTQGSVTFTAVDDSDFEVRETATISIASLSAGLALGTTTTRNVDIRDSPLVDDEARALKSMADNRGLRTSLNWPSDDKPCLWNGVFCEKPDGVADGNGHVTIINFNCNAQLNIPIPDEVTRFPYLSNLAITRCGLIGTLAPLKPELLPRINLIKLTNNKLSGTLSNWTDDFRKLKASTIEIMNNDLTGPIPPYFGDNISVNLAYNRLSGELLPEGGFLSGLLLGNKLEGRLQGVGIVSNTFGTGAIIPYNMIDVTYDPPGVVDQSWKDTQTVPPTDVKVTSNGPNSATLSWTPIRYQAHGGYYEVLSSQTLGGPYTSRGTTANSGAKTAMGLTVTELPGGTNYFVVRTFTPAHTGANGVLDATSNRNDLTSRNSAEVSRAICSTITVTNPTMGAGTVGAAFNQTFTQMGGVGNTTFTRDSGTLPEGLTLASDGTLSGTPRQSGQFEITVKATDSNNCTGTGTTYNLVIGCPSINIGTPTNSGTVGVAYSSSVAAPPSAPPGFNYKYSITDLPPGLSVNETTGEITGTPSAPNAYIQTINVEMRNGTTNTFCVNTHRTLITIACGTVPRLFVNAQAEPGGDGTSWRTAYQTLTAALARASLGGCTNINEIWVAAGTYTPDGTGLSNPRNATFTLRNNLAIYGGFSGNEDNLNQRTPNPANNNTVLSGALGNASSYHVVTSNGVNSTARLDGFTISGGNANDYGGGMHNTNSSPTLANLAFSSNAAMARGGGMYNDNSSPTLTNVTFSGNNSVKGAGMYNINNSSPTLTHVTFSNNDAGSVGGGMYNDNSSPTLTNVTFSGNKTSGGNGGGMYNESSSPTLTNVTFNGNSLPGGYGGAMHNNNSNPTLTNVTFSGNTAIVNGGLRNENDSNPTLRNCLFWGNSGSEISNSNSTPTIAYSIVRGSGGSLSWNNSFGTDGGNNLDVDPLLAALADNGGFTPTMALPATSPARDKGGNVTTLNGAVNNSTTSLTLAHAVPFAVGSALQIDNEQMLVTARNSNTLTVTRGANGTTAASHNDGVAVNPAFDQRGSGFPRKVGSALDIGAFEFQNNPPTFTLNTTAPSLSQGSQQTGVALGSVEDIESPVGGLQVSIQGTNPSNGVTLSSFTNSNGLLSATIQAACTASNASFTLAVTDGGGAVTTAQLNVTVTMNTAPSLSYPSNPGTAFGTGLTVSPLATPSDNGSIQSFQVYMITPSNPGGITVNNAGVVSVTSAVPANTYTVTIRATDNCGLTKDASFTLGITRLTSVITWNTPAFLLSGPLAASVLNATANTAGGFSYTPAAGTGLTPGAITLTANFTPSSGNYNPASKQVTLPVLDGSCGTVVNPATLPAATRGTPFVQTLSGAPTGSYVFSLLSGQLPPGINLVNTLGIYSLRGTPTTAGRYTFTIKAKRNNATCEGARTYTVVVP